MLINYTSVNNMGRSRMFCDKNKETLKYLHKAHPEWPHHNQLARLLKEKNVSELKSSAEFRSLCTQIQQMACDKNKHVETTTNNVFKLAPKIEGALHQYTMPSWQGTSKQQPANNTSLRVQSVDEEKRGSLQIHPTTYYTRQKTTKSCGGEKIVGEHREIFLKLLKADREIEKRSVKYRPDVNEDKMNSKAIKSRPQTSKKSLCEKCIASDRKKGGLKQVPYLTVRLTWRNCTKKPSITKDKLHHCLSRYGKIKHTTMLSEGQALTTFTNMSTSLLNNTIGIDGVRITPTFYYNLYRQRMNATTCDVIGV